MESSVQFTQQNLLSKLKAEKIAIIEALDKIEQFLLQLDTSLIECFTKIDSFCRHLTNIIENCRTKWKKLVHDSLVAKRDEVIVNKTELLQNLNCVTVHEMLQSMGVNPGQASYKTNLEIYSERRSIWDEKLLAQIDEDITNLVKKADVKNPLLAWEEECTNLVKKADVKNPLLAWEEEYTNLVKKADAKNPVVVWEEECTNLVKKADAKSPVVVWEEEYTNLVKKADVKNPVVVWEEECTNLIKKADAKNPVVVLKEECTNLVKKADAKNPVVVLKEECTNLVKKADARKQCSQDVLTKETCMVSWRHVVMNMYPKYKTKAYFFPPVVITRIPFTMTSVGKKPIFVINTEGKSSTKSTISSDIKLIPVQENQTKEDQALQHVLFCLKQFAKIQKENLFIITGANFYDYLGEPVFAAAAKCFLRPINLDLKYRQGDFDILLIHPKYGIVTGEIKSINSELKDFRTSEMEIYKDIANKTKLAISQLNKSEFVLRALTKDLEPKPAVHKFLVMPNVRHVHFQHTLVYNQHLKEELIKCLQTENQNQAIERCLLAENLFLIKDTPNVEQFQTWWNKRFSNTETCMTEDVYLDLIARFCGPATISSVYCITLPQLSVRTKGEEVSVVGERMMSLVLTQDQKNLLNEPPDKVMLTGPPGVGKSAMLALIGIQWLKQGFTLDIVCCGPNGLAASYKLEHTIQMFIKEELSTRLENSKVRRHDMFLDTDANADKAVIELEEVSMNQDLFVICDEFWPYYYRDIDIYKHFLISLCHNPCVHVWTASPVIYDLQPNLMNKIMTSSLRCPPAVLNEIEKGMKWFRDVYQNTMIPEQKSPGNQSAEEKDGIQFFLRVPSYTSELPLPCVGPSVKYILHTDPGHTGTWPLDCDMCGKCVAGILRKLHVGSGSPSTNKKPHSSISQLPPPLQYHDVFVLTRADLHYDAENTEGPKFVHSLYKAGIPVQVIKKGHKPADIREVAVRKNNKVTVTSYESVIGLERKIVVWLPHRRQDVDDMYSGKYLDAEARFHAMSRCTAQLVVIKIP